MVSKSFLLSGPSTEGLECRKPATAGILSQMSGRAQSPALLLLYPPPPTHTLMHINTRGGDARRALVERNSAFQVNSGRFPMPTSSRPLSSSWFPGEGSDFMRIASSPIHPLHLTPPPSSSARITPHPWSLPAAGPRQWYRHPPKQCIHGHHLQAYRGASGAQD